MGEEELVKAESEASLVVTTPPKESPAEEKTPYHDLFEKALVPNPTKEVPPSKSPPTPEKVADPGVEKRSILDAIDRDAALAKVENEKKSALIKAWEDNEKTKADNKAYKKLSTIEAWENTKRASVEAQLSRLRKRLKRRRQNMQRI
ncbi:unnamed protein product [Ilex paraguariensis]|uniref:Remorin n=1 Tax=Ilex paraguariensis TaxID=185542 RepID=A0ABC8RIL1_9AQUA